MATYQAAASKAPGGKSSSLEDAVNQMLKDIQSGKNGNAGGGSSSGSLRDIYQSSGGSGSAAGSGGAGSGGAGYDHPSYDDYFHSAGYQEALEAQRKALESYIGQILSEINQQKQGVEQDAAEAARQAYISYMQAKTSLPQALAAKGANGGLADSYLVNLETSLQNNQNQIALNKSNTLTQLELAAANARSQASQEAANKEAELALAASKAWSSYLAQLNQQAGSGKNQQAGQPTGAGSDKSKPFQWVESMIAGGTLPDANILNLPQLTQQERKALERLISAEDRGR